MDFVLGLRPATKLSLAAVIKLGGDGAKAPRTMTHPGQSHLESLNMHVCYLTIRSELDMCVCCVTITSDLNTCDCHQQKRLNMYAVMSPNRRPKPDIHIQCSSAHHDLLCNMVTAIAAHMQACSIVHDLFKSYANSHDLLSV